ncbi:ATP-binding cassette domain-containing protein [bacterium]|nr:ATP-binding cassette domain-containing protein [bacterium]MBU1881766.1 ATP-binding cassette domain-containing protein [bacterium]
MINVHKLTKHYDQTVAVDNISFEVAKGEIVGFLGPNGAGKTTTMKILTCYMPPTSGKANVAGMDVLEGSLQIRKRIGYLPEQNPLYNDLDVLEYLRFVAELRGISKDQQNARIRKMIEVCGLKQVINKNIGEMSKGFKQRVGLAQAMIHDPDILILDEPTSGLDPNQIVEIRNLIKEIGREKTVILSTHILPEVQATCNRAIIIDKGSIVADGSLQELQAAFHGLERISLEIKAAPNGISEKLRAIDHVKTVKEESSKGDLHTFILEVEKGQDLREKIFDLSVAESWKLLELHREVTTLEDVFRQLTHR